MSVIGRQLKNHPEKYGLLFDGYRLAGKNHVTGLSGNVLQWHYAMANHSRIEIHGKGNEIHIGKAVNLNHCHIYIQGDHNHIEIGDHVSLSYTELWIENDHNEIRIGANASMDGKITDPVHCAVIENTSLQIGEDCMFSSGIEIRTGDSHSVLNERGERTNYSRNITIGNHVWIGTRAMVLKGSNIGAHSVIGAAAVVSGDFQETGNALAGNPARVVRTGVTWCRERL